MHFNRVKKYCFLSLFLILGLFFISDTVSAWCNPFASDTEKEWPSYKYPYPADSKTGGPLDLYYCKYNVGEIVNSNNSDKGSYYTNKDIYLTLYDEEIYWVDPNTGKIERANKAWDTTCINQKIKYDKKLVYNYLVKDKKLVCDNLHFTQWDGNLQIYVPDDYTVGMELIKGTLMYRGNPSIGTEKEKEPSNICDGGVITLLQTKRDEAVREFKNKITSYIKDIDSVQNASAEIYNSLIIKYDTDIKNAINASMKTFSNARQSCDYKGNFELELEKLDNQLKNEANVFWNKLISLVNEAKTTAASNGDDTSKYDSVLEMITGAKTQTENFINSNIDRILENYKNMFEGVDDLDNTCEALLTEGFIDIVNEILDYVKIFVPILLIVLGSLDFSKAVLSDDKDELKKATSKFVKRCIIAVAIFFVPVILNVLFDWFNAITSKTIMNCSGR